jgi:hypothetical protein
MPIRIRCHAKPPDSRQLFDIAEFVTFSAPDPGAAYANRMPTIRSLCGSV